jgi:hypothetical protein
MSSRAGLDAALEDEQAGGSVRADVPAFPYDIYDVARLARIAVVLASGGTGASGGCRGGASAGSGMADALKLTCR